MLGKAISIEDTRKKKGLKRHSPLETLLYYMYMRKTY